MRKRTREIDEESLSALRRAAHASGNSAVAMRARAVLAFFEGASYDDVRDRLGFVAATLSKWIGRFRADGVSGLRGRPPGGGPAPHREHAMAWVPTVVHRPPRSLGIAEDRWTLRTLQQLCFEQTGQRHSQECIRLALHKLGQSCKRAKQTITSPDESYEEKKGR